MRAIIPRLITFLIGLTYISNICNAINVSGYIVSENHDTIYGIIKLHRYDQVTGALILNGFDLESLHYKITFRRNDSKSKQTFTPSMILGFGFNYDSVKYIYKRFLLEYKNIFSKDTQEYRFLNLIHRGSSELYLNTICINQTPNNSSAGGYVTYYEYFLYSNSGLIKVAMNDRIKNIRDLLRELNIDEEYIQEIPENTKFKDIKVILEYYDKWSSIHHSKAVEL